MIRTFKSKETEKIWKGTISRKIPRDIQQRARRKLRILNNIVEIYELKIPPSNHLESLKGKRKEQYSMRINNQWRICFRFENGNSEDVEIVDYH